MKHWISNMRYGLMVSFICLLSGCAVPGNLVADKIIECSENNQRITYNYRLFDGGVTQIVCE
jgi:hypothetical protein